MSKRFIIVILFTATLLALSSCGVSQSKYDELEERVKQLEYIVLPHNTVPEPQEEEQSSVEENNASSTDYPYSLESMSSADIVEECKMILENFPTSGAPYDEYISSFEVEPVKVEDAGYETRLYFSPGVGIIDSENNAITSIIINGAGKKVNMDTSEMIEVTDYDRLSVNVSMVINDYDTATEVYQGLYDYLLTVYPEESLREEKDGTRWYLSWNSKYMNDWDWETILDLSLVDGNKYKIAVVQHKNTVK